jgi:predicted dehydrogenase
MARKTTRRRFLHDTAAVAGGFWIAGAAPALSFAKDGPNDRLRIACVGVGGKGDSDSSQAGHHGDVVAICDIDDGPLGKKAAQFPKAKKYNDYRKMFDEMGKDIDAVTVSGPDHMHAPCAAMAIKQKKHVYVQKPLTHTVHEARVLRELAAKHGVCSQMGNQGTASNGLRQAAEMVQGGVIGQVTEIHVWTNRPIWPQAPQITTRPQESPPCPASVHWDLFLCSAPERPYNPCYHPFKWRGWWDFGTGALGDMACHTANMAFMACKLDAPTAVSGECGDLNPETCPSWAHVTYEFPQRGDMGPCKMFWYEGKKAGQKLAPPQELLSKVLKEGQKLADSGSMLVGTKGILFSPNDYGESYKLFPEDDFKGYKPPEPTLPRNGKGDDGMKAEWVAAIKANKPSLAMSNFEYSGRLTEVVLLGNVAMRLGRRFEWDAAGLKAKGMPEANSLIHATYRKGFGL